jgi:hypothetical protein
MGRADRPNDGPVSRARLSVTVESRSLPGMKGVHVRIQSVRHEREDDVSVPDDRQGDTPSDAPTACPFCRATTIRSPGEKADAGSYWRCEACGEMWNLARNQSASNRRYDPRWR